MKSIFIGKNVETGKPISINLEYLIDQKVQILGNSRSGKSRGGRVLAENANGKIHQIIISPKKEFVTLREKFDYLHVGKSSELSKPDIELNTRYAEQLALDIMKIGADVVIEFSEAPKERIQFVKNFVDGLMMVPQQYWHPTMIMIDEIDIWAPEKGHGEAESLGSIVDLAARGADKGYSLVAITQKLAKFNKDVASELNIKLIGNVSLDTDQNRACEELGIERRNKKILATLGKPNYHFFAYGPGLSDDVIKIKFDDPITSHVPGWKLNKNFKPIPTPENIKKLLGAFSGLEQEAEKEIKTKDDMKKRIEELEKKLREKPADNIQDKHTIRMLETERNEKLHQLKEMEKVNVDLRNTLKKLCSSLLDNQPKIDQILSEPIMEIKKLFQAQFDDQKYDSLETQSSPEVKYYYDSRGNIEYPTYKESIVKTGDKINLVAHDLGEGPKKMLRAIKMFFPNPASFVQVGAIAGYTPGAGTFGNYQRELKRKGYVVTSSKHFTLTDKGLELTRQLPTLPKDTESLFNLWASKLGQGEIKMLRAILDNPGLTLDKLGEITNYTKGGGTFGNYIRKLKRLNLIIIEGNIAKPNNEFFGGY